MNGMHRWRERSGIKTMRWCPLTCANTLASFCQFLLRAEYLTHLKMPYLPEGQFRTLRYLSLNGNFSRLWCSEPVKVCSQVLQVVGESGTSSAACTQSNGREGLNLHQFFSEAYIFRKNPSAIKFSQSIASRQLGGEM